MDKREFTILLEPIVKSKISRILVNFKQSVPTLKTIEIVLRIKLIEGKCPEKFRLDPIKLWPAKKEGIYQTFRSIEIEKLNAKKSIETKPLKMNFQYPGVWWLDVTVDAPGYDVKTKQMELTGVVSDGWPQENEKTNICRNPISAHDIYVLKQLNLLAWAVIISLFAIFISVLMN